MTQRRRVKLSANQRNDMWRRWKAGQSLHEIGRVFGKDHVSIQFMSAQRGGIVPPAHRRRLLTGVGCTLSIGREVKMEIPV